ncbi:aminotransferase class IV [Pseudomonas sp. ICMP 561]|uniref:aminotransferase class IV n=1 Tax=Pseudomonas sp. ICMP 561 TaxID=1718918 RepID=UPI001145F073
MKRGVPAGHRPRVSIFNDSSVLLDAEDYLAEAPGSNIFIVRGGAVITPADGCLEGSTSIRD